MDDLGGELLGVRKTAAGARELVSGVYGMNLQRLHLTTAGSAGAVAAPWMSQEVGFASPGGATLERESFLVTGNGNLALRP